MGQGRTRHDKRQNADIVAQGRVEMLLGIFPVGQGDNGVGMGMIDKPVGQKGMHQGFDGRVGRGGVQEMGAELVDHLLVA